MIRDLFWLGVERYLIVRCQQFKNILLCCLLLEIVYDVMIRVG
jgi:hypothetical protein